MTGRLRSERGFSMAEMLIAAAIMVTITGAVFSMMNPSQGMYRTQPEVADIQQRLRVGVDAMSKDVVMAGAGAYTGFQAGALSGYFAPVMPYRFGDSAAGVFFRSAQGVVDASDAVSFIYIPPTAAQTTVSNPMPQDSAELMVNAQANCPPAKLAQLCGFEDGIRVMIFDDTGAWDYMTITNVQPAALHLQHNNTKLSKAYQTGSVIAIVAMHSYYLKTDDATKTYQLRHDDGVTDQPLVDNVVKLEIEYFGDPRAPRLLPNKLLTDPVGPWTTYGPKPPALGVDNNNDTWGAGENCLYALQNGQQVPRLPDLANSGLIQLTKAMLTDGPWCPDASYGMRYDADLLRVRKVRIKLRTQAPEAFRGPASALFRYGGTSGAGQHFVPDQELSFDITPRNLNLGR